MCRNGPEGDQFIQPLQNIGRDVGIALSLMVTAAVVGHKDMAEAVLFFPPSGSSDASVMSIISKAQWFLR